jgi:hypothetical protein
MIVQIIEWLAFPGEWGLATVVLYAGLGHALKANVSQIIYNILEYRFSVSDISNIW